MKTARDYYLNENYNCAETILHIANEKYGLNLTEEEMRLVSCFGGGCGCGITCGVLCAGLSALSRELVKTKGHELENAKELFGGFCQFFLEHMGSYNCEEIKKTNFNPDFGRCIKTVEEGEKLLDLYRNRIGL